MADDIRVETIRMVYNDGSHNGFPDLCRFKDRLYLTFRACPEGHMIFPSSRVVVMSSADGEQWQEELRIRIPDRDVRDPHFLVFDGKLFAYFGTWLCEEDYDFNQQLGYCVWTDDGTSWHGPRMLEGTYGHVIWRVAAYGDKAYMCARRKREFARTDGPDGDPSCREAAMLESDDGFIWRFNSLFLEGYGDEIAFLFEDDGSAVGVARGSGDRLAKVLRSRPPYHEWSSVELDRDVGGPLIVKWGDDYLVSGRKTLDKKRPKTSLYRLVGDQLEEIAELPSGGDTSYPGFVALNEEEGLLSYYSSHEGSGTKLAPCAIYLARLRRK